MAGLNHFDFFVQFLADRRRTGAVAPSSPFLARLMADHAPLASARSVVEIGPGTGAFTRELLPRLQRDSRLLLVESNDRFAAGLRRDFPAVEVVQGCASGLRTYLNRAGMPRAEAVVSGLPWASMPPDLQDRLLEAICLSMTSDGVFTTFAYYGPHVLPSGRRFRHRLGRFFGEVRRSRIELRNLPPAFVYRACQPRSDLALANVNGSSAKPDSACNGTSRIP